MTLHLILKMEKKTYKRRLATNQKLKTRPPRPDATKFPNAYRVKSKMLEVIQGQGQIIFVASGWHHQVFNLEDTISINHNWLNGCNIDICWKHLQNCLVNVKKAIEDCRDMEDWHSHCQVILKADAGLDYAQFIQMLRMIAEHRLELLKASEYSANNSHSSTSKNRDTGNTEVENVAKTSKPIESVAGSGNDISAEVERVAMDRAADSDMFNNGTPSHLSKVVSEWTDDDYLTFDLDRVAEVLEEVLADADYQQLNLDYEKIAEYVRHLLRRRFN